MENPERFIALVDQLASIGHELPHVEFKANNWDPERVGTLVSAISNAARIADEPCGYIVWGIDDNSHDIVGTQFRPAKEKASGQPFELWLANAISPNLHCVFREVPHPKARVVMLEIPAAMQVPTKFKNIGYIRVGSATPKLADHQAYEATLLAKLRPFVWEQGVAKSFVPTQDVIRLLDVGAYFLQTEQSVPGGDEEVAAVLSHDKLIAKDVGGRWNVLNLGAILFARNLQDFESIARKAVRVITYRGPSRTSEAKEVVGTRGYAVGFEPLIDHIEKRLPTKEEITRTLRVARRLYPQVAVRELIANALLHQDMTISGTSPVIEIFSDRVEITNPGLPLLDTSRFIDLPPRSRNESLAALMRRIGVCEERGSGIDRVIDAVEEAQLPPPDFRAEGASTQVIIFGPKPFGELTPEERVRGCYQHAVLRYVNNQGGMTNGTLRQRFGVAERNASQISRVIKQALDLDILRQSDNWTARAGHYLPSWA
jgi:ATP-dependent DNA helicase RecG